MYYFIIFSSNLISVITFKFLFISNNGKPTTNYKSIHSKINNNQEGPTRTYVGVTEHSKLPGPRHPDAGTNPRVSGLGLAGKAA
jgi:hypothetical protein